MSGLPASVQQYLSSHQLQYQLIPAPHAEKVMTVEVSLLEDEKGRVQCFFPSDCMLDLNRLSRSSGRNLRAVSRTELALLKQKIGVSTLPALDGLLAYETWVDERVFKKNNVFIHGGDRDHLLSLNDIKRLYSHDNVYIKDMCERIPLDEVEYQLGLYDHDVKDIQSAVKNLTSMRIKQRLEETLEIPPLSDTAQAIIRLRVDPNADLNRLSAIVERDPSLAAQVVSWASSSYYAAPGSVKSVQDAIIRVLGYDLVMNLALGLSLGKALQLPDEDGDRMTPYWSQAIYTAAASGALMNLIPRSLRPGFGLVYLCGLLHNFGYLVLAHSFPPHFVKLCHAIEANSHLNPQHIERHMLGITREQICATLMKSWNLPDEVCTGIRYLHEPEYLGANSDYSQLTYLSLRLLWEYGMVDGPEEFIDYSVYENLHINPDEVPGVMEQLLESRPELDALAMEMKG